VATVLRAAAVVSILWLGIYPMTPRGAWLSLGAGLAVVLLVTLFLLITRPGRLHDARRVRGWTWQSFTFLVAVAVAVVAPALALWFGTVLHTQVRLSTTWPWVSTDTPIELIGRLLQLTLIAVASLLPALMFFQFDAERLSTLRDRWMHNIFRLDATLATVSDVESKYGRQLEEAYGKRSDGRGRLTRGRRSPLIVATIVITFGWLLILLNADKQLVDPTTPLTTLPFTSLLTPDAQTMTYAFLGAYFFGLNLVHHAYVRGDLRPKTYNLITTRVLLVVILAWLLDRAFEGTGMSNWFAFGVAFAAGLVPRTVLHLLGDLLDKATPVLGRERFGPALQEAIGSGDQLRSLDGIDLYERTRLSDEGITTLQALANHDLVDLFFKTRIAAARLVDWVDQAVLQLYLADVSGGGRIRDAEGAVQSLRRIGIRTATALSQGLSDPTKRDEVGKALGMECERLELLRGTIEQSEWAARIRQWRGSALTAPEAEKRYHIDADGNLVQSDPRLVVFPRQAGSDRLVEMPDTGRAGGRRGPAAARASGQAVGTRGRGDRPAPRRGEPLDGKGLVDRGTD
jgi:MFS family permease